MRYRTPLLLLAATLWAGDVPNTLTPEERAAGWVLLFDGRTMSGWEDPSQETPPGDGWLIEDGCLKAAARPAVREDLLTIAEFGDFELKFEWKVEKGSNSGVKYRIQDRALLVRGDGEGKRFEDTVNHELVARKNRRNAITAESRAEEYLVGFEYQVIDNRGHLDARRGFLHTAGSLYDLSGLPNQAAKPVGQFNQARVVVRGNHAQHWLNGVKVVDVRLDSAEIRDRLARRWSAGSPVSELLSKQPRKVTPIALQHHNDAAWFRSIKIRSLQP